MQYFEHTSIATVSPSSIAATYFLHSDQTLWQEHPAASTTHHHQVFRTYYVIFIAQDLILCNEVFLELKRIIWNCSLSRSPKTLSGIIPEVRGPTTHTKIEKQMRCRVKQPITIQQGKLSLEIAKLQRIGSWQKQPTTMYMVQPGATRHCVFAVRLCTSSH